MFKALWNDEAGAVLSIEYVLIGTICGIGVIGGLTSLRDGVITELSDVGGAVGFLCQTYQIGGIKAHCAETVGSNFVDLDDFCDKPGVGNQNNSRCLIVCVDSVCECDFINNGTP